MTHLRLTSWILAGLLAICSINLSLQASSYNQGLTEHLFKSYDKSQIPNNDGPTQVDVNLYILSISGVNEKTMDFTVNMYLRQRWQDKRLAHPNISGDGLLLTNNIDNMWVPDLFIRNDKMSSKAEVTTLNAFIRGDSEGNMLYSLRITSTIACPMYLARYPFDVQNCSILLESYGYSLDELVLVWNNAGAIEKNDNIELPEHYIDDVIQSDCTKTYNSTGSFTCIAVNLVLRRNVNYYIMSLFIPSILIVVLSWVAFWIDKESTPGRVSLSLLTILTMQNQMSSALAQLPKVSYIKLVDVWLTVCLAFVFAGFVEYAIVNSLAMREKKNKGDVVKQLVEVLSTPGAQRRADQDKDLSNGDREARPVTVSTRWQRLRNWELKSDDVDYYSRWVFPGSFLLFIIILSVAYFALPGRYRPDT